MTGFSQPLPENVVLGKGTWLYSTYAFLHYRSRMPTGVVVGYDTGLYNGTFFDLGPRGTVQIGNFCSLVGAIICTNSRVSIGDHSLIAHEVVIADTEYSTPATPDLPPPTSRGQLEIEIGHNVWIGARSTILGGTRIGEGAIIGAATGRAPRRSAICNLCRQSGIGSVVRFSPRTRLTPNHSTEYTSPSALAPKY